MRSPITKPSVATALVQTFGIGITSGQEARNSRVTAGDMQSNRSEITPRHTRIRANSLPRHHGNSSSGKRLLRLLGLGHTETGGLGAVPAPRTTSQTARTVGPTRLFKLGGMSCHTASSIPISCFPTSRFRATPRRLPPIDTPRIFRQWDTIYWRAQLDRHCVGV